MDDRILAEDIRLLGNSPAFAPFVNSTIMITGATGLLGSLFVKGLLAWNDTHDESIDVIALARNQAKATEVFGDYAKRNDLHLLIGNVAELPPIEGPVNWISHGASMTASSDFVNHPVEVATTELAGTRQILELARKKNTRGMVYLSSLEVYGFAPKEHGSVVEDYNGPLNHLSPRNSYPSAKRMSECLCASYASEYGVHVKIARLAQTFGAGVAPDDMRVFAQFARAALADQDIVMHTPGEGGRCYCYTTDAIEGLATVLASGADGEAYNVANPQTYCSFREMAEMVANLHPDSKSNVVLEVPNDLEKRGYSEPSHMQLSSNKLLSLGWQPRYDLPTMYQRLMASMSSRSRLLDHRAR